MVGSSGQPASNVSSTIPRTTRATGPAGSVFNTLDFNKSDLLGADQSDDRTSATTLRQMNRFRKFGACNYQNVDLFKIPDALNIQGKQRRQRSLRLSQIDNYTTHASLNLNETQQASFAGANSSGFKLVGARSENIGDILLQDSLQDKQPDEMIHDAYNTVRNKQKQEEMNLTLKD